MWNLNKQSKEQTKQNRNRVTDKENNQVVAREEEDEERKEMGDAD